MLSKCLVEHSDARKFCQWQVEKAMRDQGGCAGLYRYEWIENASRRAFEHIKVRRECMTVFIYSYNCAVIKKKKKKRNPSRKAQKRQSENQPKKSKTGFLRKWKCLPYRTSVLLQPSPPPPPDEVIPTLVFYPSSDSLMHSRWGLISNGKINGRIIALGHTLFHTHILAGLQGYTEGEQNLDPFASLGLLFHCDTHTLGTCLPLHYTLEGLTFKY